MPASPTTFDLLSCLKSELTIHEITDILLPDLITHLETTKQFSLHNNEGEQDHENGDISNESNSNNTNDHSDYKKAINRFKRLSKELKAMKKMLDELEKHVKEEINSNIMKIFNVTSTPEIRTEKYSNLVNLVTKLAQARSTIGRLFPSMTDDESSESDHKSIEPKEADIILKKLHERNKSVNTMVSEKYKRAYQELDEKARLCLLCFAAFPGEEAEIKKKALFNWWGGEEHIKPNDKEKSMEEQGDEILHQLAEKGFFHQEFSCSMHQCFTMEPHVRLEVMTLTKDHDFFCVDPPSSPTNWVRVLLDSDQGLSLEQLANYPNWGTIKTLFNIDETILRIDLRWFKKLQNLTVLCLGNWCRSVSHHIEADNTEFLRGLKHMKHLRVLSLRGVSRIVKLHRSVNDLSNLHILDLRACHDLEELPKGMGKLKNLTHLNLWGCYQLLDHMPRGIASLPSLKVLKGFVVGERKRQRWCSLDDLSKLKRLEKLSIHTTNKMFPSKQELKDLQGLEKLKKLTIEWGGKHSKTSSTSSSKNNRNVERLASAEFASLQKDETELAQEGKTIKKLRSFPNSTGKPAKMKDEGHEPGFPKEIEKLDLRCIPYELAPYWLSADKLQKLKKLYIRGGELKSLINSSNMNIEWKIERLRLKFLNELRMNWSQWEHLFPNLQYIERQECRNLTLSFPIEDGKGWKKLARD